MAALTTRRRRLERLALSLLGAALVGGVWVVAYPYTRYLQPPWVVWDEVVALARDPATYTDVLASLRRLVVGLGLGYLAAFVVTLLMRLRPFWNRFFSLYVFTALTIPSLAMALLSLMVFGLSEVGVYVAVGAVVFPFVVVGLVDGFKNLDARLGDMARVYRFGWRQRLRHVAVPEMSPYLFSAFRNAHALAWKIVIVTEVFSQSTGIGYQYSRAFDNFQLKELVAWVVYFLAVVFCVEYGILRPMERRAHRWRAAMGER